MENSRRNVADVSYTVTGFQVDVNMPCRMRRQRGTWKRLLLHRQGSGHVHFPLQHIDLKNGDDT
jgi:hypothetical protein